MQKSDLLFIDKPAGWLTHSDGSVPGINEWVDPTAKVVHRLDRDTTGCLVLARSADSARVLTEAFSEKQINKTYLFVTDRQVDFTEKTITTFIRKEKNQWQNFADGSPAEQAETKFSKLSEENGFSLWQARPVTGKTHQIRLHAQALGLSLLGDEHYGGSLFPSLMLHCSRLQSDLLDLDFSSPTPLLMQNLGWCARPLLSALLCQLDRRQRLHPEILTDPEQTLRLAHDKDGCGYYCDKLAELLWFYRFREGTVSENELNDLQTFQRVVGSQDFVIRQMENRGENPHLQNSAEADRDLNWLVHEGRLLFEVRAEQGWSPGVFLDQRSNREWVRLNSQNKTVLNLFCYTAGFSIAAAHGMARKITSVDTSKKTLEWAKKNFVLNGFKPEDHFFSAMDTREFLKMSKRQNRDYDLIICDPPSFARNKNGVFRIEKDFTALVQQMSELLSPSGQILFSTNYEKWEVADLIEKLPPNLRSLPVPRPAGDYESPQHFPNMKTILLEKKN